MSELDLDSSGGPAATTRGSSPWSRWLTRRRAHARASLRTVRLLRDISRSLMIGWLAVKVAATAVALLSVAALGLVIGTAGEAVRENGSGQVTRALIFFGGVMLAQQVLGSLESVLSYAVNREVDGNARRRLRRAVGAPDGIAHLEDSRVLDSVTSGHAGVFGQTVGAAAVAMVDIAFRYATTVGQAAIVAQYSVPLAVSLLAVVLLARMTYRTRTGEEIRAVIAQMPGLRRQEYLSGLIDSPVTAKENRVFGLGGFLLRSRESVWREAMDPLWAARAKMTRQYWNTCVALAAVYVLTNLLLARSGLAGAIGIGGLALYVAAASGMLSGTWIGNVGALEYGRTQLEAIARVEAMAAPADAGSGRPVPVGTPRSEIRFENVSFAYPGREPVFTGLNLTLHAGQSVAVVGVNGAGKTTLIKLLCGLYRPQAGRILIDGHDLQDLHSASWRRSLAVIFQDFVAYPLPASDNVAWGAPAHPRSPDALRHAAQRVGALALIEGLPHGWETTLSKEYTDGADLSGGQWQRLALARALYAVHAGARVLVLDEPTANLDVRAEAALFAGFLELTAGLTTVLVSHRFSSVRRAERIIVLDRGAVRQDGTHEQLMVDDGPYRELFTLQATRFHHNDRATDSTAPVVPGQAGPTDA